MRSDDIDVGLSVLCLYAEEGEVLTFADIASVCGCTTAYIRSLQVSALKKLKRKTMLVELHKEFEI